jgi:hypothetical protein
MDRMNRIKRESNEAAVLFFYPDHPDHPVNFFLSLILNLYPVLTPVAPNRKQLYKG